jgi:uncharacterized protein YjbJ (UPF0337 family)
MKFSLLRMAHLGRSCHSDASNKGGIMNSVKGSIKEAAGFIKEETGEKLNDEKMAQEGRELRNEGRMERGKAPKLTKPGTDHPEEPTE